MAPMELTDLMLSPLGVALFKRIEDEALLEKVSLGVSFEGSKSQSRYQCPSLPDVCRLSCKTLGCFSSSLPAYMLPCSTL